MKSVAEEDALRKLLASDEDSQGEEDEEEKKDGEDEKDDDEENKDKDEKVDGIGTFLSMSQSCKFFDYK